MKPTKNIMNNFIKLLNSVLNKYYNEKSREKWFIYLYLLAIVSVIIFSIITLYAFIIMVLWNNSIALIFAGAKKITLSQSILLILLIRLLKKYININ